MTDFFLSYTAVDRAWAEWIAWQLEDAGYTAVLQAWDFRPGSNFVLEMQTAATQAERMVAVLSPDYLSARFTQPEWAAAFARDPTGVQGTLLPVRVRECDLTGLLSQIIYVDLVGLGEADARAALLAGVKRSRAKPGIPSGFPGMSQYHVIPQPRFPGILPPIWNVPHLRNLNFTGRDDLLAHLRANLTSGQPAALTQAISGLGGVGKTQLAVEYAYRHAADYDLVWWIRAEEPATLAANYAGLAAPLGLPQADEANQRLAVGAVRRWLGRNRGWLLIFDNATDPASLQDLLPQGGAGHVLITSRNPNWRGVAGMLSMKVWPRAESVAFLLKRTGQTDVASADALADALGDLPLALEQAGAYMEVTGRSIADYLDLFRERQSELLRRGLPTDYPATVATTWEISFEKVEEESPVAAQLLNVCAFLAPVDIPREILTDGAKCLPRLLRAVVVDAVALDEAIAVPRRYSLLEASGDTLTIHRLVQAVIRDRLTGNAEYICAEAAVNLINSAFPYGDDHPGDVRSWPKCARLLQHAMAVAEYGEHLPTTPRETARLLNQVGLYLQARAEFSEAVAVLQRALAIAEVNYGPNHSVVALYASNFGSVLHDIGNLAEAQKQVERALGIKLRLYGPKHPAVAECVNNLGTILQDCGDLVSAQADYEWALAIARSVFGLNHPRVARYLNNLGDVLREQGKTQDAQVCFEGALAVNMTVYGPDHPIVATNLNNLGRLFSELGDLKEAQEHYERALTIAEITHGSNHPDVATVTNNLGCIYQKQGDFQKAQMYYKRALGIFREFLGENHPKTIIARNSLEALEAESGKMGSTGEARI